MLHATFSFQPHGSNLRETGPDGWRRTLEKTAGAMGFPMTDTTAEANFSYGEAFARNTGWVTAAEQVRLRNTRVAIAGLGGVGGSHLLTLTRLGVGRFSLAEFDTFELANFNRQAGATLASVGKSKLETLVQMARQINPELDIRTFPDGVTQENLGAFLDGVDVYVDGLDFFALSVRCDVFAACHRLSIPAVTAAPLGMGAAVVNFVPGHMSFDDYFGLQGQTQTEQLVRFLVGLSPAMLQRGYLVDRSAVDFVNQKGPSTPMACEICAGIASTEVLKMVLRRGSVRYAPWGLQFDAYRNRLARTWRPGGIRNPLQQIAIRIARMQLKRMAAL